MNTRCSSAPPSAKGGLVSLAGLLALLSAPLVQANTLNFVPDGNGAATPLFDPDLGTQVSPVTSGNVVVLSGETLTINTTSGLISYIGNDSFSLGSCTGTTEAGANGSKQIVLFTFNNLTVNNGAIVNITGNRAVGLIARNAITIDGTVNMTGHSAQNGYAAGGLASMGGYAGGAGSVETGAPGVAGGGVPGFGGTGGSTANGGGGGGGRTPPMPGSLICWVAAAAAAGAPQSPQLTSRTRAAAAAAAAAFFCLPRPHSLLAPMPAILAQGGSGGTGLRELSGDRAGGGGGGAGGSVVLCAPGIVLGGQINLAGGPGGTGLGAGNGFTGATGRLAIYSKTTPTGTATITATRFDNATSAYPAVLEVVTPSIVSITMDTTGNPILRLIGKGTPGGSYQLERSTDLETWTFDGSPRTATATGEINVTRTANPTLVKKLFYRLREL